MAVTIDGVGEINGVVLPTTSFGKVLQVVRATDSTNRSTTSTSFVDVTGMSVTITPQKNTSAILILAQFVAEVNSPASGYLQSYFTITDASNNSISGAQNVENGIRDFSYATTGSTVYHLFPKTLIAYATPSTTSAVTYKLRMRTVLSTNVSAIYNANATGQMYAIEVSA